MNKLIFTLAFILTGASAFAQTFTFNQGGPTVKNYYTELPYQNIYGKLVVTVELSGVKHRFLFDTGAPVALSKQLAAQINAKTMHVDLINDANGVADSTTIVGIDDIRMGDVIFSGIPALVLLPDMYKCWNVEGVVGSNMLRNSIVSIVADRQVIIITDEPDKLSLNKKHSVPLVLDANNNHQSDPVIKVFMNKVSVLMAFDSGQSAFLRFTDDYMNQLGKLNACQVVDKGYGASQIGAYGLQANADKYLVGVASLNIGSARFDNITAETNKNGNSAFGTKLLDYGNITLDFIHGKFYFDPRTETTNLAEKHWPFSPTMQGNKLVVGVVWQKGATLVKPGEQITAINGKDYSEVSLCDMLNNKPPLNGYEAGTITIKDAGGQLRNVQIVKE